LVLSVADPPAELAAELRAILAEPLPSGNDPLDWELRSVRQRRAALRHHAAGLALVPPPVVSALLVSADPDALRALAGQTYPELDIVLGARQRSAELNRAIAECARPVRVVGSTELAELAAQAQGSLLTVFDPDAVYGPEHVWDLVLARHYSGAAVVGKAAEFVFLEPLGVTVRRAGVVSEEFAASVSPTAALVARADLASLGGRAGLTYRTHSLGYVDKRRSESAIDLLLKRSGPQWTGLPPSIESSALSSF
jgi:hypothetical protein